MHSQRPRSSMKFLPALAAALAILITAAEAQAKLAESDYFNTAESPWLNTVQAAKNNPDQQRYLDKSFPGGMVQHGKNGEVSGKQESYCTTGARWPAMVPPCAKQTDPRSAAAIKAVNEATGCDSPAIGANLVSGNCAATAMAVGLQQAVARAQMPESVMPLAKEMQNQQNQCNADNCANMERNQAACAIEFVRSYLENFTSNQGNQWNKLRNELFIPIAILLLLPGAVLAQAKATVAQGFPIFGQVSPFDGILRAIVAVFLIPATYLVVNYGIDLSNSINFTIRDAYQRAFGSDMYRDAMAAHIRAFPVRQPSENLNHVPNLLPTMKDPLGKATTAFARMEGRSLSVKLEDPVAGLSLVPPDRANEMVPYFVNSQRLAYNGANAALATTWSILCAFQMVYLYYLWFVGPIVAALWVWPMKQLRDALPNWLDGVITICFWSLFWNTSVLLMACFRGVDDTGTVIMTALNFLSTACVKFAFDFSGLVKAAGAEAAKMAEKAMQGSGKGSGGGGTGGGNGSSAQSGAGTSDGSSSRFPGSTTSPAAATAVASSATGAAVSDSEPPLSAAAASRSSAGAAAGDDERALAGMPLSGHTSAFAAAAAGEGIAALANPLQDLPPTSAPGSDDRAGFDRLNAGTDARFASATAVAEAPVSGTGSPDDPALVYGGHSFESSGESSRTRWSAEDDGSGSAATAATAGSIGQPAAGASESSSVNPADLLALDTAATVPAGSPGWGADDSLVPASGSSATFASLDLKQPSAEMKTVAGSDFAGQPPLTGRDNISAAGGERPSARPGLDARLAWQLLAGAGADIQAGGSAGGYESSRRLESEKRAQAQLASPQLLDRQLAERLRLGSDCDGRQAEDQSAVALDQYEQGLRHDSLAAATSGSGLPIAAAPAQPAAGDGAMPPMTGTAALVHQNAGSDTTATMQALPAEPGSQVYARVALQGSSGGAHTQFYAHDRLLSGSGGTRAQSDAHDRHQSVPAYQAAAPADAAAELAGAAARTAPVYEVKEFMDSLYAAASPRPPVAAPRMSALSIALGRANSPGV